MNSGFKLLISRSGDRSDGRIDSISAEHFRRSHTTLQVRTMVVWSNVCLLKYYRRTKEVEKTYVRPLSKPIFNYT
jgi:hypothetical protein